MESPRRDLVGRDAVEPIEARRTFAARQSLALPRVPARVMLRAEKMEREVRLVADDPTVVSRADIENVARLHFIIAAVIHPAGGRTGNDEADVLNFAQGRAGCWPDVLGPFPSWLVTRAADGHRTDLYDLEFAFGESADFVRLFEALDQQIDVGRHHRSGFKRR